MEGQPNSNKAPTDGEGLQELVGLVKAADAAAVADGAVYSGKRFAAALTATSRIGAGSTPDPVCLGPRPAGTRAAFRYSPHTTRVTRTHTGTSGP